MFSRLGLAAAGGHAGSWADFGELRVWVSADERGAYRLRVEPRDGGDTAGTPAWPLRSAAGDTEMRFTDGWLQVCRGTEPDAPILWRGRVSAVGAYGRAGVPGTRLEWAAPPGEALYGLGERFDGLNVAGKIVEMWIRDAAGVQGAQSYFCSPVLFSSAGYALFAADNPEGEFSLNPPGEGGNRYVRAGRAWTFYLAFAPTLKELVLLRARVQGPFRGIPDWAWGPWISRNSYENRREAEEALQGMIRRGYPVAAMVQEAWKGPHETGDFNNFSAERWPDVADFLSRCRRLGVHTILWQVPALPPVHPDLEDLAAKGLFVSAPDGSLSRRQGWLKDFVHVDFTRPEAAAWWKDQMRDEVRQGVRGFKADDGEDIQPDDVFADGRRGWQMHNEYPVRYAEALYALLDEEGVDGILWCRSGSLGSERTPALWAGDQHASWAGYRSLLSAGLSAGLSGAPFWGHDIGGYLDDPSPELYIRWLQFGAFSPLMQYHGIRPREPWHFGPEAEVAYRLLSHLRMNVKPMLVELGREAARTGLPIMRPMVLEFPGDPRFLSEDSQYMLGPDLLVAPVLEENTRRRLVKFPAGRWHHLLSPAVYEGPSEQEVSCGLVDAPVFVREGARLKVQRAPGAALGMWSPDAPVWELRFSPK